MQFGKKLIAFPRVADKIAMMAAEADRPADHLFRRPREGRRPPLRPRGPAWRSLIGARIAWAAADKRAADPRRQRFALEYPVSRVLCDARILNIFEGAAEIQAQVIARRLLEGAN